MFRASSCPSSGAQQLQLQPLVLPLERADSSAVGCLSIKMHRFKQNRAAISPVLSHPQAAGALVE